MSVDIEQQTTAASPESDSEGEGLTSEDIEELNTISLASMKFLTVRLHLQVMIVVFNNLSFYPI